MPTREAAARGAKLLRAWLERGLFGTDPETVLDVLDVIKFVEGLTMAEKMFPLQPSRDKRPGPLSIPWSVAEKAYGVYAGLFGRGKTLERLAERGGFGVCEMDTLYPAWRAEVDEITRLRAVIGRAYENACAALVWCYDPAVDATRALPDALAEVFRDLAELRTVKIAVQETPKQWSTAQAPTLEAIAATALQMTTAQKNKQLREENEKLRADLAAAAERIAAQSELLSRKAEPRP